MTCKHCGEPIHMEPYWVHTRTGWVMCVNRETQAEVAS